MPFKLDIFNKEVLAKEADYRTINVLISGDDMPEIEQLATTAASNIVSKYLPLSGGTLTGTLNLTSLEGGTKSIILYSHFGGSVPLCAAKLFPAAVGDEYGLAVPALVAEKGRIDMTMDPVFSRTELRINGNQANFNIYNKDTNSFYLRLDGSDSSTSFFDSSATGFHSFAVGTESIAEGSHSSVRGYRCQAKGAYSHAEGYTNSAFGDFSHVEGSFSSASGENAHAEGKNTDAKGSSSHSEGSETLASGEASHAEGILNEARGRASHAAGIYTIAQQDYTYAWGSDATRNANFKVATTRTGQYMVSASGGMFIPGNLGIGTDNNSNALTVNGLISTFNNGTSNLWQSAYTTVQSNSSNWNTDNSIDLGVRSLSGNWESTYTTVQNTSANWNTDNSIDLGVRSLSGNWESTYTTVLNNSANWNTDNSIDLGVRSLSGNWESTYTTVLNNSANWNTDNSIDLGVRALSGNWESTYTTVQNTSANWNTSYQQISANDLVRSNSTFESPTTGISAINNIVALSLGTYNNLSVKLPSTLYIII